MLDQTQVRRLYRSRTDIMFAGVAGGIAEYFRIDPTLARVFLFLALAPLGPLAIIAYLVLATIIPVAPPNEPG
jgi:phage shock protein PspC (stress-responsive transcriptional regulator)